MFGETLFERAFDFALNIPKTLTPFVEWLFSEQVLLGNSTPIECLAYGGFIAIITLHVLHLVNVVSG